MNVDWVDIAGIGTVHTWTITHHAFHPRFKRDLPYILLTVDLPECVPMNAQARGIEPAALRIGMPVKVEFETAGDGLTLPIFAALGLPVSPFLSKDRR